MAAPVGKRPELGPGFSSVQDYTSKKRSDKRLTDRIGSSLVEQLTGTPQSRRERLLLGTLLRQVQVQVNFSIRASPTPLIFSRAAFVVARVCTIWASCSLVKMVYTGTPSAWAISLRRSRSRAKAAPTQGTGW